MKNRFECLGTAGVNRFTWFRMPLWISLTATLFFLLSNPGVQAAPFRNLVVPFTQPDGTKVEVIGTGDEFYAKFETKDGYTVVFDSSLKAYCYARVASNGTLESTGVAIHSSSGAALGLDKHLKMSSEARKAQVVQRYQDWDKKMKVEESWKNHVAQMNSWTRSGMLAEPPTSTTVGNKVGLTLLIDFDDDPATIPQADIIDFLNGDNYTGYGNNGSVKSYYSYVSNGKLTYTNAVIAYVRIPNTLHPKSYYNDTSVDAGYNARQLINDALTILQATSDYTTVALPLIQAATVDDSNLIVAFNVFYTGDNGGVWSAGLWPHSSSLETPITPNGTTKRLFKYQITNIGSDLSIGTFCHENGHMLCGYPDIYDYDYDSVGGAGNYCLMSFGSFDKNPVQICAYLKRASGWTTTTELSSSSGVQASLTSIQGANFNHIYRYQKPGVSTEYYLFECRFASGRDALLPGSGILIWHVDELGDRDNQSLVPNSVHANYELTLVQADNFWDFEKNANKGDANDPYYASNPSAGYGNEFSDSTQPSSHWWDGTDSGLYVHDIADKAPTMSLVFGYPSYVAISYLTNSITGGNGNGMIDYNECNNLTITVTNRGTVPATSVQGILTTTNENVFIAQPYSDFATIAAGDSAMNRTAFRVSTTPAFVCGTPIVFQLALKSDQGVVTNKFTVKTGTTGKTIKFSSSSSVTIPDFSNLGIGAYSPVTVSGVDGLIRKVAVSAYIEHSAVSDLMLELVAPDGSTVILANRNGGAGANFGVSCDGTQTTFDDDAAISIASGAAPFAGSFQPLQPLASFSNRSGTNVNGVWKLHAVDKSNGDVGTIQCWSLMLVPSICTDGGGECAGVDLSVTMAQQPVPASVGIPLTYTMVVSNAGPSTAKGVIVTQTLPLTQTNGVVYSTSVLSQGSATPLGDMVNCNLGSILPGKTATIQITVIPQSINSFTTTAIVGSTATDYNSVNDAVSQITTVMGGRSDLSVSISATPSTVLAGGTLTYNVGVINYGTSAATNVMVTNTLPVSFTDITVESSQGSSVVNGNVVITALGNMNTNATASLVIKGTPVSFGQITAVVKVGSDMLDPVMGNNTASVSTLVSAAADVSVSVKAQPNPVLIGSNLTYTITVSNQGPSEATAVSLTHVLPASVALISSSASQGDLNTNSTGLITGNLGTLVSGASATVQVVIASSKAATLVSTVSVTSERSDSDLSNNSVTNTSIAMPPVALIGAGSSLLTVESYQPANGVVEPGETVSIQFGLANRGTITASNVVAQLQLGGGVLAPQTNISGGVAPLVLQSFGDITPGATVSQPFKFTAVSSNIGTITATLLVKFGTNAAFSVPFQFVMPNAVSFTNDAAIVIPDSGNASVYPSVINVSGVAGSVQKVTATLKGFTHTYPHDVSVLLVNPTGSATVLMSHASKDNGLTNGEQINLTFDADADTAIPASSRLTTGSYGPAQYSPFVTFTNAVTGPYVADLSIFGGVDPNGEWKLYVIDDSAGDAGSIIGGWSLSIVTVTPVNPVADLKVSGKTSVSQALIGNTVTFTYVVTNSGPSTAESVVFTNTLSDGFAFVSSSVAGTAAGQQYVVSLGDLPTGSATTLAITAKVIAKGSLTSVAAVASKEIDLGKVNNTVTLAVAGLMPTADISVAISDFSSAINTDNTLSYTILVTNSGPDNAGGVVVTAPVVSGFSFVSAKLSQGSSSFTNGNIIAKLGSIPSGSIALVDVTLQPTVVGSYTITANASTESADPDLTNNVASFEATVKAPGPIVVGDGVKLISESGPVNGAIDNNETVTVAIRLTNKGTRSTTNLVAALQSGNGVVAGSSQTYGVIGVNESVTRNYTFTAQQLSLSSLTATLVLTDGTLTLDPVSFEFQFPSVGSFTNSGSIVIPDSGPALIYPSAIQVAGLYGAVSKVSVKLYGFAHTFPRDVSILLVSPDNASSLVISHVGGANSVTNLNLTISADSASVIPATNALVAGSYLPTKYGAAVAYPNLGTSATCSFDVFKETNPNGTWLLYVVDDSPGDGGVILGGWSLDLETVETVNPATDLAISMDVAPHVATTSLVTNTIAVQNNGPNDATHVIVTNVLPAGAQLVSAVSLQGVCNTNKAGVVSASFGTIASGNGASFTVVYVTAAQAGETTTSATVYSDAFDTIDSNNSVVQNQILTVPQDSKLVAAYVKGNGQVQLTVVGQPNHGYSIQASSNLMDWTVVSTNTLGSDGTAVILVTPTSSEPYKFYRTIRLP